MTPKLICADWQFEQSIQRLPDFLFSCECKFTKGLAGVRGRKPCHDGVLQQISTGKVYCLEMKRPSECVSNGWLNSYRGDRFPVRRKSVKALFRGGKLTREKAEAHVILAEHDEHMSVMGSRWNAPTVFAERNEWRNVIALPLTEVRRMEALKCILHHEGRFETFVQYGVANFVFFSSAPSWSDMALMI